ncbi:hypothetical protein CANCADRAFT_58056 [Tortispora caseinolytica NRRL Y-17796]|uniref:Uncharacterized protein n=1 Tax=Tortispora caseinolytica NRRL Y-17796 TaxID=767744 RepID=A0A1E4TB71_9ASCO|nr:hypothetical protein CANCADRAFT_58056 [Tortispora caseinolytica NRRL Y-17796]
MADTEFVTKHGPINFTFIDTEFVPGRLYTKPVALNYFHNGRLYRTKGERTAGQFELFFDLLYVGLVANFAETPSSNPTGLSLVKYIIYFLGAWQIWADLRDFMNYYYTDDLIQRTLVLWTLTLLVVYGNNVPFAPDSRGACSIAVGSYLIARFSVMLFLFLYSFPVYQHRLQMRMYSVSSFLTVPLWIALIFVSNRAKVGLAFASFAIEHFVMWFCFSPYFKTWFKLEYSTAVNIEHEVDRYGAFYVIALGEFLYGLVAGRPTGPYFTKKLARAICSLLIAYGYNWFYYNGAGYAKSHHPLRRNMLTALCFLEVHIPLIASLVVAADACTKFIELDSESTKKRVVEAVEHVAEGLEHEEVDTYALQFFLCVGLAVALLCLTLLAYIEEPLEVRGIQYHPCLLRLVPRILVAGVFIGLPFAEMQSTSLIGLITGLIAVLFYYETLLMQDWPAMLNSSNENIATEETNSIVHSPSAFSQS